MSRENVDLVRRAYEEFGKGGPDALISAGIWAPDIVFDFSSSRVAGLGVYRGHGEVRKFFEEDWFGAFPFEEWEIVLDELIPSEDRVLAISRQRGRGASSGAVAELEQGLVFTVRDGQFVRVEVYGDVDEARQAAGLSG